MFIVERERHTEREEGRGREGDTESETGSRLSTVSTEPKNIQLWSVRFPHIPNPTSPMEAYQPCEV